MSIGENIKRIRLERGLTQKQLAEIVGVTSPMITQIERGTRHATMELGKEIADALSCDINEFYRSDSVTDICNRVREYLS